MGSDPGAEFLGGLTPQVRGTAERLVAIISAYASFDVAIKWRQLTFAVDEDFDHWVCAVAASSRQVRLTFHFGAWLDAPDGLFEQSDARFVRRMGFASVSDIDEAAVRGLLTQALVVLPRFRETR